MLITLAALAEFPGPIRDTHAFFTRGAGSATALFASLNCGFGSRRRRRASRAQPRDRRLPARAVGGPAGQLPPGPRHRPRSRSKRPWRREENPRADGDGDRGAGDRARRARGRLRAGSVRRSRGADHRRGAWRLARRAGRRHGGDRRGDDARSAPAPSGSGPASARASRSPPTRSGRNFTRPSPPTTRRTAAFSGRRRVPAIFCSICPAISPTACRGSASPRSSARRTTRPPRRSCFSATGAPACAANRITAAVSRRSRSRPDRAMPYLVMFGVVCLLGLLATCAML